LISVVSVVGQATILGAGWSIAVRLVGDRRLICPSVSRGVEENVFLMLTNQQVKRGEVKTAVGGVEVGVVAFLLAHYVSRVPIVAAAMYVLAGCLIVGVVVHHRWYFSARKRLCRTLGAGGWLDRHDLRTSAGERAMRAQAEYIRPGLPVRLPDGRKQPVGEYATCLGRLVTGSRSVRGTRVYSPHSRGMLVIGPTGSGKTSWMVHSVLDFPGAAYVTSTRPELVEMTAPIRARRGPVYVFNPANLGGIATTLTWDPAGGCEDQATADARAWGLVRGGGGMAGVERPDFWAQKAQEIIRCYLMAAALRGFDMGAVHYWATNPDDPFPVDFLQAHPERVPAAWVGTLQSYLATSRRTRDSFFATVLSCVGFMDNPTVAAACRPQWGRSFDVREFLDANGTLYVICDKEEQRLTPLMTAFTENMFRLAKQVAAISPGGRLTNGLSMVLDEVAHTTPIALDQWTADSRGWNISTTAIVQNRSQLATTWGPDKAETIYANLPIKVVLPGVAVPRDVEDLAYLAGRREIEHVSQSVQHSRNGHRSVSKTVSPATEPVITGHTIYSLPQWHAYVVGAAPRSCVVTFEPGHQRVKRERRRDTTPVAHRRWGLVSVPVVSGVMW
jgi:type IV secretion system protein VirD4